MSENSTVRRFLRSTLMAGALVGTARGDVVINEIFYNSPADLDRLEFVELYNSGSAEVKVGGWRFSKGITYEFPNDARIAGDGYLVLCADRGLFREMFQLDADGQFDKSISNGGETLTLKDADGKKVDSVKFDDEAPWPKSADGYSASLERICPSVAVTDASNWAPSLLSDDYGSKPSGTPGKRNSVFAASLPPVIEEVSLASDVCKPDEAITVQATIVDAETALGAVRLCYRIASPGSESDETTLPMSHVDGRYVATIPGQEANRIIRYRIMVTDQQGSVRFSPHPHSIRPALSVYVSGGTDPAMIPVAHFFNVGEQEFKKGSEYRANQSRPRFRGRGGFDRGGFRPEFGRGRGGPGGRVESPPTPLLPQGRSALIFTDPETGKSQLFDFINIAERKSGYKVRLHKDRPLDGMTTLNVLYEPGDRTTVNEALAYDLYHLSGNATVESGFVRVLIDGSVAGYHLWFEQPNGTFFRRHDIDDSGNLYKLIWMGSHRPSKYTPADKIPRRIDIVGRHEKVTNPHDGYDDIVGLIEALEDAEGDDVAMWQVIQTNFDVDQVINYFAVNSLLSHWDGFFNNYFLYHDSSDTKQWTLYPWDQDSTWSTRMGSPGDLSTLPLDYGAEGALPPGAESSDGDKDIRSERERGRGRGFRGFGGGRGGPGWWRNGGDISRPLLAHPEFRKRFRARLKTLTETQFNETVFGPKIDALRTTIEPEVRLRAQVSNADEAEALRSFEDTIETLREHLLLRRNFVLKELAGE